MSSRGCVVNIDGFIVRSRKCSITDQKDSIYKVRMRGECMLSCEFPSVNARPEDCLKRFLEKEKATWRSREPDKRSVSPAAAFDETESDFKSSP